MQLNNRSFSLLHKANPLLAMLFVHQNFLQGVSCMVDHLPHMSWVLEHQRNISLFQTPSLSLSTPNLEYQGLLPVPDSHNWNLQPHPQTMTNLHGPSLLRHY